MTGKSLELPQGEKIVITLETPPGFFLNSEASILRGLPTQHVFEEAVGDLESPSYYFKKRTFVTSWSYSWNLEP